MTLNNNFIKNKSKALINYLKEESCSFFFACICVIIIPLYNWYFPPFMVLWVITRIIEIKISKQSLEYKQNSFKLLILFLAFFLWQVISLFYSKDMMTGFNVLISGLSFILFPMALVFPGQKVIRKWKFLLKLFAGSTMLHIILCFIVAFIRSVSSSNGIFSFNPHPPEHYWLNYFYGTYFSFNQHPTYVAMYVTLSLFIAFEFFNDSSLTLARRIIWLVSGFIYLITIYLLSSRSGILAVAILIPVYIINKLRHKKKWLAIAVVLLLFMVIAIPIIRSNERIKISLDKISSGSVIAKITEDSRILIWNSALKIIKKNPVLGVGIGDVRTELAKEYDKIGNQDLIDSRYNAHNQFIEVCLESGIIGLLLFLIIFGFMIYIAISEHNQLYLIFLIMIFVFFMFETVLYRLAGVSFFSLLSFLLLINTGKTEIRE